MIRIEPLDDGFLVIDTRGPRTWRGAAVSYQDAEIMAKHRANPDRLPTPPPCLENSGYAESTHPLAAAQFDQATGDVACIGGVCTQD